MGNINFSAWAVKPDPKAGHPVPGHVSSQPAALSSRLATVAWERARTAIVPPP